MNDAFIFIGSNIDRERNYIKALKQLARLGRIKRASTVYVTAPVGGEGDDFLNGAVLLKTPLRPHPLKRELRAIEQRLGRTRTGDPNAPRTIDLDLVLYNAEQIDDGEVRVPDPLIFKRPFLVQALAELSPDYRHPSWKETIEQIAGRHRPADDEMRPDATMTTRANEIIEAIQTGETTHA
ncbi:MAG: 2-amino-4-hydroxy-6-hydroxymethyldihydropteridine diphosphokinase [Rudaea sp.]